MSRIVRSLPRIWAALVASGTIATLTIAGEQPTLFVAGSTLAVAALFNPLRRLVLQWVDRRFFRSSYDSEIVVAELASRVGNEADVEMIVSDALAVAVETMQPDTVGLWVKE